MTIGGATPYAGKQPALDAIAAKALLDWYALSGVDAAVELCPAALSAGARITATPVAAERAQPERRPARPSTVLSPPPSPAGTSARGSASTDDELAARAPSLLVPESRRVRHACEVAQACDSLDALAEALNGFDGCALKDTAKQLCFADGNPRARLMLIGEAPGAEEDRQGKPFVGPSGQLLDRMLAQIGIDRSRAWITNVIYWRPPGNRSPTTGEIAVCLPFLERQIELLQPAQILFVGGIAAKALLGRSEGVTKLRGRPFGYSTAEGCTIPCLVTFHPAYLLRQPLQKRYVWRDLLTLRERLDELGVACA